MTLEECIINARMSMLTWQLDLSSSHSFYIINAHTFYHLLLGRTWTINTMLCPPLITNVSRSFREARRCTWTLPRHCSRKWITFLRGPILLWDCDEEVIPTRLQGVPLPKWKVYEQRCIILITKFPPLPIRAFPIIIKACETRWDKDSSLRREAQWIDKIGRWTNSLYLKTV